MKTVKLPGTEAHLSKRTERVVRGEKVAKRSGWTAQNRREPGFHPTAFRSDLLEPITDEVAKTFCDSCATCPASIPWLGRQATLRCSRSAEKQRRFSEI